MYKKGLVCITLSIFMFFNVNTFLSAQEKKEKPSKRPSIGLSVRPGGLLVQYVPLGVTYDFYKSVRIPLTIHNKDTSPHTYILSTHQPSQVAAKRWVKGYLEIPEPRWFWFERDEVTVEANSKADVKMYLRIPDDERYYNQHWVVSLGVAGKPASGATIALAIYPRIQIETEAKDGVKASPDGSIGFVPSILVFENLSLGTENTMKVKIYNNETKKHHYKVTAMIFPEDPKKSQIFPSPTYSWISNTRWINTGRKNISIASNESRELPIRIKIPKQLKNYKKRWEAIIFVEPDEGLPGFVRVQIKTERRKK
jgi:hypothetical protein